MFFNNFPRNTRITLLLEPYSSVLACILTFYATLHMQAQGVDARQIGLIATLAGVAGYHQDSQCSFYQLLDIFRNMRS